MLLARFQQANRERNIALTALSDTHLDPWMHVVSDQIAYVPPLDYRPDNIRTYCRDKQPDECRASSACTLTKGDVCRLTASESSIVQMVNRLAAELSMRGIAYDEVMRSKNYSVSNVIDRKVFSHRPGEQVLSLGNIRLDQILDDLFSLDQVFKTGKKIVSNLAQPDYRKIRQQYPSQRVSRWISQQIISGKDTIIRAFTNCYYWLLHPGSIAFHRNLGYYSSVQTKLTRIYKSQVITWIECHQDEIVKVFPNLTVKHVQRTLDRMQAGGQDPSNGLIECYTLSRINRVGIILYNRSMDITYAWNADAELVVHPGKSSRLIEYDANQMLHIQLIAVNPEDPASKTYALYPRSA